MSLRLSDLRALLKELRRRQVVRVAGAYAIISWLVVQVAVSTFPYLSLPEWMITAVIVLTALGFPVALVLAWAFEVTPEGIQRTEAQPRLEPGRTADLSLQNPPSVAVLPFRQLGPGSEDSSFADAVTEEVLGALASVQGIRVASRTSSFAIHGNGHDVRSIARTLGVGAVLEGTVRKIGSRVRISATLIDALDGCHLVSEIQEREIEDVLGAPEEVSLPIARAVRLRLLGTADAPQRMETASPEAAALYREGQTLCRQRTPSSLQDALARFDEALVHDPRYAAARAARAGVLALLGDFGAVPREEAFAAARAEALRAIEVDPAHAEGHAVFGFVRTLAWEWTGAEANFRRALSIDPENATTHHWYSIYLAAVGRLEEAVAQVERAKALDPGSVAVRGAAAGLYYYAKKPDRAIDECRRVRELDPDSVFAHALEGMALAQAGRTREGEAALSRATELAGTPQPFLLAALGHLHARSGRPEEVRRAIAITRSLADRGSASGFCLASLHAFAGDADAAFEWLERAVEQHDGWILSLRVHPWMDGIRPDPRFGEVLEKVGLRARPRSDAVVPA